MTEYKETQIIAVDHGYGNIKTVNTVTPAGITEYDSKPVFTGSILEYDGKWYRVGERHKEFLPDKAGDEDYYLLTLVAAARELRRERIYDADVHIACGLPLSWVRNQREEFRSYILRKKKVTFRYDDEEFRIRITGCTVFPQGYPAIVRDIGNYQGAHMVADIGNGTMNVMYIIDKKVQEERCWTEKLGVNQCMIRAKNAVMDRFGLSIEESIIERFFRYGTVDLDEKYLSIIRETAEQYVEEIFSTLRKYEYNPDLVKLHIVGGGSTLVKHFGNYDPTRVEINDDVCAAAKGYEYLALLKLRKENP